MIEMLDIKEYLPHRYPFLLVDRILECDTEARCIVGIKNVTINEPYFNGHFPTKPIMPGVLIVEALAQTSGILAYVIKNIKPMNSGYLSYLAGMDKTKFKHPVVPGDRLKLVSEATNERMDMMKFKCNAYVDDNLVCTTELLVAARKT